LIIAFLSIFFPPSLRASFLPSSLFCKMCFYPKHTHTHIHTLCDCFPARFLAFVAVLSVSLCDCIIVCLCCWIA
jgi:hypothetical protein